MRITIELNNGNLELFEESGHTNGRQKRFSGKAIDVVNMVKASLEGYHNTKVTDHTRCSRCNHTKTGSVSYLEAVRGKDSNYQTVRIWYYEIASADIDYTRYLRDPNPTQLNKFDCTAEVFTALFRYLFSIELKWLPVISGITVEDMLREKGR